MQNNLQTKTSFFWSMINLYEYLFESSFRLLRKTSYIAVNPHYPSKEGSWQDDPIHDSPSTRHPPFDSREGEHMLSHLLRRTRFKKTTPFWIHFIYFSHSNNMHGSLSCKVCLEIILTINTSSFNGFPRYVYVLS